MEGPISVCSSSLVFKSRYKLLTSTTEASLVSWGILVRLGLTHPSLSGVVGFPCQLAFFFLPFFLLGARLQAVVGATVAGPVRFPGPIGLMGISFDWGNCV